MRWQWGTLPAALCTSFHSGPEEKERQPEEKSGPVMSGQAVSPAPENKLSEGRVVFK